MRRLFLTSLCLVVLAVAVPPAGAAMIKRLTTEELAARAEVIVLGQHLESRSVWVGRMLVTRVTVAVGELLKGQTQSTVTVDILGGIDMNRRIPIGMTVPGAPRIHSGEQVVLFLSRREGLTAQAGSGEYEIVGFSQGKLSVIEDEHGRPMVATGAAPGAKTPLAEFKAKIQEHVSKQVRERPSLRALPVVEGD